VDHKFSTKLHQRPLTQPQTVYLHQQVEIMEKAGIIRPIHPRDVKCVSPIKLAQKEHDGGGLTQDELKHVLNDECVRAGLEPVYDLPPHETSRTEPEAPVAQRWRICQNFHELNDLLKVVPVQQVIYVTSSGGCLGTGIFPSSTLLRLSLPSQSPSSPAVHCHVRTGERVLRIYAYAFRAN
jgi:hypothetical protein